jgi:hypothetical protein
MSFYVGNFYVQYTTLISELTWNGIQTGKPCDLIVVYHNTILRENIGKIKKITQNTKVSQTGLSPESLPPPCSDFNNANNYTPIKQYREHINTLRAINIPGYMYPGVNHMKF